MVPNHNVETSINQMQKSQSLIRLQQYARTFPLAVAGDES